MNTAGQSSTAAATDDAAVWTGIPATVAPCDLLTPDIANMVGTGMFRPTEDTLQNPVPLFGCLYKTPGEEVNVSLGAWDATNDPTSSVGAFEARDRDIPGGTIKSLDGLGDGAYLMTIPKYLGSNYEWVESAEVIWQRDGVCYVLSSRGNLGYVIPVTDNLVAGARLIDAKL